MLIIASARTALKGLKTSLTGHSFQLILGYSCKIVSDYMYLASYPGIPIWR